MFKLTFAIAAASIAVTASVAQAETRTDPLAAEAITQGSFQTAEQKLDAERRVFRDRPEILLNLAAVYARTGRATEARALYRDVLARDEVLMDMRDQSVVGSHAIASRGLVLIDRPDNRVAGK